MEYFVSLAECTADQDQDSKARVVDYIVTEQQNTFPRQKHQGKLIKIHINKKYKYLKLSRLQYFMLEDQIGEEGGGYRQHQL